MNSAPLSIRTNSLPQWERLKGSSESWACGATKIASVSRSAEQLKYASLWLSVVALGHIFCLFDSSLLSSVVAPNCQVRLRKCLCQDSFVLKHYSLPIKWKIAKFHTKTLLNSKQCHEAQFYSRSSLQYRFRVRVHDPRVSRGSFAGDPQVRVANEVAHFDYANKTHKGKPHALFFVFWNSVIE